MDQPEQHTQRPMLALILRLGAALVISSMVVLVKLASESGVHLIEIIFWRAMPAIPILLIWFTLSGSLHLLQTERAKAHGVRAIYGVISIFLNFAGMTMLPLAELTAFGFTSAFWAVIFSALMLGERIGAWRWSAVCLGFAGVLVIAQPGSGHISQLGAACTLGAALMIGLTSIQVRDLGRTEQPLTIVFYFSTLSMLPLVPMVLLVAEPHSLYQWSLLAGIGLTGVICQVLLTAALRFGTVASVIVMDYSGLIWAALFGFVIFDNLPAATTWLGAPLIVAAGLLIAWREHQLAVERTRSAAVV